MTQAEGSALIFDAPLYTFAEAAAALGVPVSTFAAWARGYEKHTHGKRPVIGAPVVTAFDATGREPKVPFVGLAEGMTLAAIRHSGVSLQRIRPALARLSQEIGVAHALASRSLYSDGAEVLFDYATHASGDEEDALRELVVVRSGQRVFVDAVEQYLQRITYGDDGYARRLRLPAYTHASVIADPTLSFGQPIFERGGVRVIDVMERFWAGEDIAGLSAEFGVPNSEIEDALRAASRRAA